mgnify:FL=1
MDPSAFQGGAIVPEASFPGRKIGIPLLDVPPVPMGVSEDCPTVEMLALLDDPYARNILTATSERPMSAKTLSQECDASLPTIYRRAERLVDCGLLEERTEPAEDGHHYSIYEARLRRLSVTLKDGELHVTLEEAQEPDIADRFTDMWEGV